MGTLCKNCPFKHTKKEEGHCTDLFIKKYHNSCVTYDIVQDHFMKELNEFAKQKKNEETVKKEQEKVNEEETVQETTPKRKPTPRKNNSRKNTKKDE